MVLNKPISPVLKAWYKWKSLRLPWRKQFLIGLDLQGNTFWEFRDVRGSDPNARWRRIVRYPSKTHYGEVKVSPAWHQWLRHTRKDPPSLQEQQAEQMRQERIKMLAAQADAKWAGKPSLMDAPGNVRGQPQPALGAGMMNHSVQQEQQQQQAQQEESATATTTDGQAAGTREQTWEKMKQEAQQQVKTPAPNPWKQAAHARGPSEEWQPQGWNPAAAPKK